MWGLPRGKNQAKISSVQALNFKVGIRDPRTAKSVRDLEKFVGPSFFFQSFLGPGRVQKFIFCWSLTGTPGPVRDFNFLLVEDQTMVHDRVTERVLVR